MAIGDKIKSIRMLRGMTQKELGLSIGLPAKSADVWIAQYEIGARVPKENLVKKIAGVLKVNPAYLTAPSALGKEDVMRFLFFLDDNGLLDLHLHKKETEESDDEFYVEISLDYIENLLDSWYDQKTFLENGVITEQEYMDWKLNWTQIVSDWKGMPFLKFDDE